MRNLRGKYRAWRERRRKNHIQWWERKRAGGKSRYVLWVAMWWGGWMVVTTSLIDYSRGNFEVGELVLKIIFGNS